MLASDKKQIIFLTIVALLLLVIFACVVYRSFTARQSDAHEGQPPIKSSIEYHVEGRPGPVFITYQTENGSYTPGRHLPPATLA